MEDLDKKIIDLMDLFDGEVTTTDKIDRPEESLRREMFEDANKRFNFDNGGRIGYASAGLVKTLLSKIKPYKGATKIGESHNSTNWVTSAKRQRKLPMGR